MKKWFSFALVLALCLTTVWGGVPAGFAEEASVVAEAVDPEYADTEQDLGDLPDDGGADDSFQIDMEETEVLPGDTDAVIEAPAEFADASTEADLPLEEDAEPAFVPWYAATLASLTLEMDEIVSCIIPEGSVLLVTGEAGEGLLSVACGTLTGVVDATALAALTEDELRAFMDQIAPMEEVTFYQDMPEYPLPPMPAQPIDEPVAEPEAAPEDANPEVADSAEETDTSEDEATESPSEATEDAEEPAEGSEQKEDAENPEDGEKKEDGGNPEDTEKKEDADNPDDSEKKAGTETPEDNENKEASVNAETAESAEDSVNAEAAESAENGVNPEAASAEGAEGAEATATADTTAATAPVSTPTSIVVNLPALNLGVKEKFAGLTANVVDQNGTPMAGATINWASSNVRVVRVDAAGKLTAVRKGKATIVVRADGLPEALVTVVVKAAPSKVNLKPKKVLMSVGTTWQLAPTFNKGAASAGLTFTSSNPAVAQVSESGLVTGVAPGKAFITVRTFNKKKARVRFTVTLYDYPADMVLNAESITIGVKEKYQRMGYTLIPPEGKENCEATVKWKSKNTKIAKVNAKTGVITGVKAGTTIVYATTSNKITRKVKVVVIKKPKSVVVAPKSLTLAVGAIGALSASYNGNKPTANVTYTSSDPNVATVDALGIVTGVADGTAVITVSTYNNKKDYCNVTIGNAPAATDVRYRMFAAYNFYNVLEKGSLSFPMNNATSFQKVLAGTTIGEARYENVGTLENASKDGILSGIANAFADGKDTDVNVVYLCSHGTNYVDKESSGSTHYGLQLPGYSNYKSSSAYYITSEELYAAISAIKGKVVLVLDSCYSGVFISNMKSSLEAEGGRISVITAANNTKACYYNVTDVNKACDFFTYYLLEGAGYDMQNHSSTGSCPADSDADKKLTLSEMFAYAKKQVTANMKNFKSKSWFHGDASQTPCIYEGSNGGLVLFQYA